jgi:hypothetical protein
MLEAVAGGTAMKLNRILALAMMPVALAVAPGSASNETAGCGLPAGIRDPGIRASFERFERGQSAAATMICAGFLNTVPGEPSFADRIAIALQ